MPSNAPVATISRLPVTVQSIEHECIVFKNHHAPAKISWPKNDLQKELQEEIQIGDRFLLELKFDEQHQIGGHQLAALQKTIQNAEELNRENHSEQTFRPGRENPDEKSEDLAKKHRLLEELIN